MADSVALKADRTAGLPEAATLRPLLLTSELVDHTGWGKVSCALASGLARGCPSLRIAAGVKRDQQIAASLPVLDYTLQSGRPAGFLLWDLARDLLALRNAVSSANLLHAPIEPLAPLASALKRSGQKLVVSLHGTYALTLPARRWSWLNRFVFAQADALVCSSNYTARRLLQKWPKLSSKVHVIPLGVEPAPYQTLPGYEQRRSQILFVGEPKPRKGLHVLLRALKLIVGGVPDAQLLIVGQIGATSYWQEMQRLIETEDLGKHVQIIGRVERSALEQLYREVRVMCLPSLNSGAAFEGFGLVHLEANAWGCPSIGSFDCGNEDAVAHDVSGYLVGQNDHHALAQRLLQLLTNRTVWNRLSLGALEHTRRNSWHACVSRYVDLYCDLLDAGRSA